MRTDYSTFCGRPTLFAVALAGCSGQASSDAAGSGGVGELSSSGNGAAAEAGDSNEGTQQDRTGDAMEARITITANCEHGPFASPRRGGRPSERPPHCCTSCRGFTPAPSARARHHCLRSPRTASRPSRRRACASTGPRRCPPRCRTGQARPPPLQAHRSS